jgi:hypothetical protein
VSPSNPRIPVNEGVLYGKYCGKGGTFYYCPSNLVFAYSSPSNGWATFAAVYPSDPNYPVSSITWGGYTYGATFRTACFPVEGETKKYYENEAQRRLNLYIPAYRDPLMTTDDKDLGYADEPEEYYKQPGVKREPTEKKRLSYETWLKTQMLKPRKPHRGRLYAIMSDMLTEDVPPHRVGYNVLFSDYHAKWVGDPEGYVRGMKKTSGKEGTLNQYAAFNYFSERH